MNITSIDLIEKTAKLFPHKEAIEDSNGIFTFEQLRNNALKIAKAIGLQTTKKNQPIAVLLPKSKKSIVAFIGSTYSGNFYAPLDMKSPLDRLSKIINKLEVKIIITNEQGQDMLNKLQFSGKVIDYNDAIRQNLTEKEITCIVENTKTLIDTDPIYAIFTSGSTGVPKGVLVSHRSVIDYINWAIDTYNVTEKEIIGSQKPFYFDGSTLDIYLMLATGAKLLIVPENKYTFPIKLIEYINEKQINFVFWVPSVLISISKFNLLETNKIPNLQKILIGADVMPNRHLNYWRKHHTKALYSNLYGPTETTVDSVYYIIDRTFGDNEPLPIGRACRNTDILILNKHDELVKKGEVGELCVRGTSLALGYYNDPEKTAEVFVQNPLNKYYPERIYRTGDLVQLNDYNEIMFLGRKDYQIKHMGYRIELGEIENALFGVDGIDNACVLYDNKEIVAFYVGNSSANDIRKALFQKLPKYMIPTKWQQLEKMPLNANGKINRKELQLTITNELL